MDTAGYKLRYTQDFRDDLTGIVDYIAGTLLNPDAAQRLVDDVHSAILERLKSPASFEQYHSRLSLQDVWYRIRVRNFTVFYVVEENTMEVRRILYEHRDWKSLI